MTELPSSQFEYGGKLFDVLDSAHMEQVRINTALEIAENEMLAWFTSLEAQKVPLTGRAINVRIKPFPNSPEWSIYPLGGHSWQRAGTELAPDNYIVADAYRHLGQAVVWLGIEEKHELRQYMARISNLRLATDEEIAATTQQT
jgi:hypothetical protein